MPISERHAALIALLAVAGCGGAHDDKVADARPDARIECAMTADGPFDKSCALESASDRKSLILWHKDGGFRRITVADDGTLSAADGADAISGTTLPDGRFEIVAGTERYRLPPRR
jgi:hypothetical protein